MSSVRIREPKRTLKLGKYVIPLSKPEITSLRKSKPFWTVLGESRIFSAVLRVPITFPPDKFSGVQLAAMCVPDLLGTQGTFSYYAEQGEAGATHDSDAGGQRIIVKRVGKEDSFLFEGAANSLLADQPELRIPFVVSPGKGKKPATIKIGRESIALPIGEFTPWVKVAFSAAPGLQSARHLQVLLEAARRQLRDVLQQHSNRSRQTGDADFAPAPFTRVIWRDNTKLSRRWALAEDTWSLSEGLMNEDAFLQQAYDIHRRTRDDVL